MFSVHNKIGPHNNILPLKQIGHQNKIGYQYKSGPPPAFEGPSAMKIMNPSCQYSVFLGTKPRLLLFTNSNNKHQKLRVWSTIFQKQQICQKNSWSDKEAEKLKTYEPFSETYTKFKQFGGYPPPPQKLKLYERAESEPFLENKSC